MKLAKIIFLREQHGNVIKVEKIEHEQKNEDLVKIKLNGFTIIHKNFQVTSKFQNKHIIYM